MKAVWIICEKTTEAPVMRTCDSDQDWAWHKLKYSSRGEPPDYENFVARRFVMEEKK